MINIAIAVGLAFILAFYGLDLKSSFTNKSKINGAEIFIYNVPDPERYGVVEIINDKIISIVEKPLKPKSNLVVTGLYYYDNSVKEIAKLINPSNRNELEITDINKYYLENMKLNANILKPGMVWLDAGTSDSLLQASLYVKTIQDRQNIQIGCPEEISVKNNWISKDKFAEMVSLSPNNSYGKHLKKILKNL